MNLDLILGWSSAIVWVAAAIRVAPMQRSPIAPRVIAAVVVAAMTIRTVAGRPWIAAMPLWAALAIVVIVHLWLGPRRDRLVDRRTEAHTTIFRSAWLAAFVVLGCLSVLRLASGSPDPLSTGGHLVIGSVGAAVVAVQVSPTADAWRWIQPVASMVGVVTALATTAVVTVHYGFGRPERAEVSVAAAVAAAGLAAALAIVAWTFVQSAASGPARERSGVLNQIDWLLGRDLELGELLEQVADVFRREHDIGSVEIWTHDAGRLVLAASAPQRRADDLVLSAAAERVAASSSEPVRREWVQVWMPGLLSGAGSQGGAVAAINYGGELRGVVAATPAGERDLDDSDLQVLRRVAQRLGSVVHGAVVDDALAVSLRDLRERERELRASRVRLVSAADAERARIERDLHDGAQQQLVALAINIQLARTLVDEDPARARDVLAELHTTAQHTAAELRSLSHGIYPSTLREEGIGPALDAATAKLDVPVHVSSEPGRLTVEAEVAVYFVCMEAISNALKHANASAIDVRLRFTDSDYVFEVSDDGAGFDDASQVPGRGLQNMRDRIGAVDGEVTVSSSPAGTRVVGTVPLN